LNKCEEKRHVMPVLNKTKLKREAKRLLQEAAIARMSDRIADAAGYTRRARYADKLAARADIHGDVFDSDGGSTPTRKPYKREKPRTHADW